MKREPLLPVKTRRVFHNKEKETPNLSGLMHVNAIPQKQSLRSKSHPLRSVAQTEENISGNKNVKYVNQKQEQFHRLNRQTKIQDNAKWSELLNKQTEKDDDQNYLQRIIHTNKAIDKANSELQNINSRKDSRKSQMIAKKVEPRIESQGVKAKVNKSTEVDKNHKCAKSFHSNTMDILTKKFDKQLNIDLHKEQEKQRRLNKVRSKKIDQTISIMNEKLNHARGRYFNNDYETNHITSIMNKKHKYYSIKDIMQLEKNSVRLSTMEASKLLQSDLENDLKMLRSSSPILNQTDEKMDVLYKNIEFLQSDGFQDDFSDVQKNEECVKNKVRCRTPSPTVPCILKSNKSSLKTATSNRPQLPKSSLKTLNTEIPIYCKSFASDTDSESVREKRMTKSTKKPQEFPPGIMCMSTDTESDQRFETELLESYRKSLLTSPRNFPQSKSTSVSEETDSEHPLEQEVKRSSFLRKQFGLGSGYDITKPISKGLDFLLS